MWGFEYFKKDTADERGRYFWNDNGPLELPGPQ